MAYIEKRANGTYRVRVRRRGYPPQTAIFSTLSDAKKWAYITEGDVLTDRHFPSAIAKKHTVSDLIQRYVRDVLPRKSSSSQYIQGLQFAWWKKQIGHYTLAHVTPALIAEQRDKIARHRKNSTVRRYLAAISHAFTVAVREYGWMESNPVLKISKPSEPVGRVRYLDDDERMRLLAQCRGSRCQILYTVVVLALSTGARKGELLGLHWGDVDLKRGVFTFRKTKNGSDRVIPVTGYALDQLRAYAKVRRIDSPFVFPNPSGNKLPV